MAMHRRWAPFVRSTYKTNVCDQLSKLAVNERERERERQSGTKCMNALSYPMNRLHAINKSGQNARMLCLHQMYRLRAQLLHDIQ